MSVLTTSPAAVRSGKRAKPRAGVIGLGAIGGGVAVSLARRGRIPAVYDIRPGAADTLAGVPSALASPAAVARESDVVLIAVVDADQARSVLSGANGVLSAAREDMIVVLLCTVAVPVVHELAETCAEAGVRLLDCGVTPGYKAAENGMVAITGGDAATVEDARPVLEDWAKLVVHCGPLGAGMATKIARNIITYGSWRVVYEAARLVKAAGVDPATLITVIDEADPEGATLFTWLRKQIAADDGFNARAASTQHLQDKDLAAAQDLAAGLHVPVPLVDLVRSVGAESLTIPERSVR